MIRIDFSLGNPFKHKPWRDLYQGEWLITKNTVFEIGFFRYAYNIAEVTLDLRWQGSDHAGPEFEIGLFGWQMRLALKDTRHWDYQNNTWQKYDTD
jgi:hypothetical protein